MQRSILIILVIGLCLSGVEGAVDAASLVHADGDTTQHEVHYQHPGDEDHRHPAGDPVPSGDPGQHQHVCHCGVHIPPLSYGLILASVELRDAPDPFEVSVHTWLGGPPPLPPPID